MPYIIGWVIASFATNIWYIYISRLFVGTSHALLTTSIYAIEITNKDMRATFSFLEGVPRCIGSIIIYILGMYCRWKSIAYGGWVVPLMAMVCLKFCPESPVFLINKGKEDKALKVLERLNSNEESANQGMQSIYLYLKG